MVRKILLLLIAFMSCLAPLNTVKGEVLRGEGDFEFFIDAVSLPSDGDKTLQIFHIAIPSKEIGYLEDAGSYSTLLRIHISLNRDSKTLYSNGIILKDTKDFDPASSDISEYLHVADSCIVPPGIYGIDVKIEDMQRNKRNLLGLLKGRHLESVLKSAFVDVIEFSHDALIISDPVLIWKRKADGGYIPNPMEIYGLKNDTLSFVLNMYLPSDFDGDSLNAAMSIFNGGGDLMNRDSFRLRADERRSEIFGSFDVNRYPAGKYRIYAEVYNGSGIYASAEKSFSVAWELLNWKKPRRDLLVEARILFKDSEYERFKEMSIGEQEQFLDEFWRKQDPTPNTGRNEIFEKFVERVEHADKHFMHDTRGALTQRGQIYIRFGEPSRIEHEAVPKTRVALESALDKVEDRYQIIVHGSIPSIWSEEEEKKFINPVTVGSEVGARSNLTVGGHDTGAFELWIYDHRGDPILEKDKLMHVRSGLRFLFVDKEGSGRYELVGSS